MTIHSNYRSGLEQVTRIGALLSKLADIAATMSLPRPRLGPAAHEVFSWTAKSGRKVHADIEAFTRTGQQVFVSDLDRPFRHPVVMASLNVTPMHHQMSMGSSAKPAPRRRRA